MKKITQASIIFMIAVFASFSASGSHFRYGDISWRIDDSDATGKTIEFRVNTGWRVSPYVSLNYGGNVPQNFTGAANGAQYYTGTKTYTFPNNGTYRVYYSGGAKIGNLENNANGSWYVYTDVNVGTGNNSPVTSLPAIVNVQQGLSQAKFLVPAADPDGDVLSFRLASSADGWPGVQPSGLSINSSTGEVTWNTIGKTVGDLWNMAVIISDGSGSEILVDFIMEITQQSNPPQFDYSVTPANAYSYQTSPGSTVSFSLKAFDNDPGSTVSMFASGMPTGATISPAFGATGNPITHTFSWTPTASQFGQYLVNFTAQDNNGVQVATSVSINVSLKPVFDVPPTPVAGAHGTVVSPGTLITYTVQASDPDPADVVQIISMEGKNHMGQAIPIYAGASFSALPSPAGNPTSGIFSWTPTQAQWGHKHVYFTAQDSYGDQTVHEVSQLVNTPPVFASSPVLTADVGQLYTYNIQVSDPDQPYGDMLSIFGITLPSWLSVTDNGDGTATLSGTPSQADAGINSITIQSEDLHHHDDPRGVIQQLFDITVNVCQPITYNSNFSPVECVGGTTTLNYSVSGGSAPYTIIDQNGNVLNATAQEGVVYTANVTTGVYNYSITDANGCPGTGSDNINQLDNTAPTVNTQSITVYLDASGTANILASDIDNGSYDNCGIANLSLDISSFSCSDIGNNLVELTVTDNNGNSNAAGAIVTVFDTVSPTVLTNSTTIYLDHYGNASLSASAVDNGSNDACGISSISINRGLFTCSDVGANTVILTVNDNKGNTSTGTAIVTVLDTVSPLVNTNNVTVYLDSSGSGSIKVFDIDNGSSDNCGVSFFNLDQSDFDCSDIGVNTVNLTVFDINGNSSTGPATVTVIDDIAPIAIAQDFTVNLDANGNASISASDIDNGSYDSCGIASITVNPSTFNCSDVDGDQSLRIITDSTWTLSTVVDSSTALSFPWPGAQFIPPVSTFNLPVVLGQPYGYPSINVVPGSDLINANSHITYYRKTFNLTSVDQLGARLQLAVDDDCEIFINGHLLVGEYAFISATFQGLPMDLFIDTTGAITNGYNGGDAFGYFTTTSLDSIFVLGENEIIVALRNRVGGDRGGLSMVMDVFADFDGNEVTLTVTDSNGNTSTAQASVTVVDPVAPNVISQGATVYLDANGNATVNASDVDNGSNDACGIEGLSLDVSSFTCANVGANTVNLTATDINGNSATASAIVTVVDSTLPDVITQDITVYLDANGNASIAASDIDNGSSDNCAVASLAVSPSNFNCSDVDGDNSLQIVTDSTWTLSTVVDSSTALTFPWVGAPFVPAVSTFSLPVVLGQPYGYPSIVIVPGSDLINANKHVTYYRKTFNLSSISQLASRIRLSVDDDLEIFINGHLIAGEYAFNASSFQGVPHDVLFDQAGNVTNGYNGGDTYGYVSSTPLDSIFVLGQNEIIVALRNRVGGDRGGLSMVIDIFADFQGNAVNLAVTDVNGNTATGAANVIVVDTIAPVLVQVPSSFTSYTLGNDCTPPVFWLPPSATDACAVQSVTGTHHPGDHFPVGVTTVTYTALDIYGNSSTASFDVTVVDTIAPTAICNSISIGLDATGNALISAADIDGGSIDACGIASTSIDVSSFGPSDVGAQTVTLTVVDIYGNTATCSSIVNVIDTIAPSVVCQDIVVGLGSNGLADITAADIDNGSGDATGIASMTIDNSSFSCGNIGANTVVLTVVDNSGNSSTCVATVTVIDTIAPVIVSQNITIQLSSAGQAIISPSDLDGGSTDACGIDSYDIDMNSFGCNDLGQNTVLFSVTDVNGNTASQLVTVTVEEGFVLNMQTLPDVDVACNVPLLGKIINWTIPQVTTSTSCAPDACPAGNNIAGFTYLGTHDGHRYFRSKSCNYSWNQANAAAQAAGGHLAVINTSAENHFLACRVQGSYSWIGLNDVASEGQHEWVNGEAISYTNWAHNEPNNTGGYYCGPSCYGQGADQVALRRWSGKWYDRRECNKHEFIMEVPCGNDVVVSQIAGLPSGSLFPEGITTITYVALDTVTGATDTSSFNITIGNCTPSHCPAKGICSNYEWINRIEMGSIDNTSGNDNGYADYSNHVTHHNKNQKVYFKLHPGFQGSKYKEYWRIFVDWNNDGDFNDYKECVYQGKGKNKKSGNFKVPSFAASGNLRVRVVMKWGGYAGPCSIFSYGEVEDYSIVVDNATGASSKTDSNNGGDNNFVEDGPSINQELFNLYPNPVLSGGEMTLDIRSASEEEVEISIASSTGQLVFIQKSQLREGINSLSIKPGDLSAGAYFIQISNSSEAIPFVVK
tara:strand:+ start:38871 stop:45752 length:6882 start_codon:yes stop_codon:yes gene_type:complete